MGVIQPITKREERIVTSIPDIEWRLVRTARPRKRQPATEIILDRSIGVAEQKVGDTSAFPAWQPRSNKGIGRVDFRRGVHGASGKENGDDGDALRFEAA